jgi:AcrR family transcriptional regulator
MASKEREKTDDIDKRDLIVSAATRCFMERGFAATRIAEIADAAGVGKGTVYEYFRAKEELLAAACLALCLANERAAAAAFGMDEGFAAALPADEHPVAFIHRAIEQSLTIVLGNGPAEQQLFSELHLLRHRDPAVTEPACREIQTKYATWASLATGWFSQAGAGGCFRDDVAPAVVAELILAVFDGLIYQSCWIAQDRPAAVGRRIADVLCRLLLKEPGRLEEYLT